MYERFISSSMFTGTLLEMSVMVCGGDGRFANRPYRRSNIEVLDVERVVFDELAARLDLVAHQGGEHQVRGRVIFRLDLQERPLGRIHRGLPQRVRVHLAEALVAVDGDALLAGGDEELDEIVERFDVDLLRFTQR